MRFAALAALATLLAAAMPAQAQTASITGQVSALLDHLPGMPATELRLRAIADASVEARPWLRFRFSGLADGLAADRSVAVRQARADALEAWVEVSGAHADLRAGMSRLAWGRLDEVQPTDVINPIDVARYLLDGRSEARIAVPLVRARFFPGDRLTLEGVIVPVFRPGTFDRLDEATSPFNLFLDVPPPACAPGVPCPDHWQFVRDEPDAGEMQGGARVSVTTGRVDWSVSAWRGFVPFALLTGVMPQIPPALRLAHPRYTMVGGDFETVRGKWAIRGEAAYFPDRPLQIEDQPATFAGDSFEAGAGVDRRAGDFTLSGTMLFRRTDLFAGEAITSVSVVGGFSRTFNRDRIETRVFSLVNPEDRAGFVRGLMAWKPADDLAVEASIGWFIGDGDDVITRFGERDFGYVRLKYYFGR
jgi:hypothetical protein